MGTLAVCAGMCCVHTGMDEAYWGLRAGFRHMTSGQPSGQMVLGCSYLTGSCMTDKVPQGMGVLAYRAWPVRRAVQ